MTICRLLVLAVLAAPLTHGQEDAANEPTYGHSSHGEAYDVGPRTRPWKIDGIGRAPFPITTSVPEVQEWFDQGNALLHSFWYREAERAFRWCTKLDPDCAMAYLGLSRSVPYDRDRADAFMQQAIERKGLASEHEQRWIDAFANAYVPSLDNLEPGRPGWNAKSEELAHELEQIVLDYPGDVEAKAFYCLNVLYDSAPYAVEAVLQEILREYPEHPGAIHYRIHNWDTKERGAIALESCADYGRVARASGHANHMPGHIYTKLGMWHEGAISLDAATRVEKQYMQDRLVLPHQAWNYPHNRNFLAHAQSMLGLPSAALQGAYDMLNAPLDPEENKPSGGYSVFTQGMDALRRTLVRYERWETILEPGHIPWEETPVDGAWRAYCEGLAHVGMGDLDAAEERTVELAAMAGQIAANDVDFEALMAKGDFEKLREAAAWAQLADLHPIMVAELEGRIRLARGEAMRGLELLTEAARLEFEHREEDNDPPTFPRSLYNVLGETYLDLGSPRPAIGAFEKALESMPNNGYSWSGLARAHHELGDDEEARRCFGHMLHVWSAAEPGLWQLEKAHALGLSAEARDPSPSPQRSYAATTLAKLGPNTWQPYAAPKLAARDAQGNEVSLEDFQGKNVLLVYYLSDQCVHCVEQLREIEKKAEEFAARDTVLLAISADPPERNASGDLADMRFTLLSDTPDHANAIRYKSFDEFEEIELHSTNLIDRKGRLRWVRTGGDPFMNLDFLLEELDRIEEIAKKERLEPIARAQR